MTKIEEIEGEIAAYAEAVAVLRGHGARALADAKASGHEVMNWLKAHGATDADARRLCVEIIHERRAASTEFIGAAE